MAQRFDQGQHQATIAANHSASVECSISIPPHAQVGP